MDWEQNYIDGTTPWEKGEASPPLAAWLEGHALAGQGLVPGCGMGHDAAAIAESEGADSVVGLDLAPSAIQGANERYGTIPGLSFVLGDLFQFDGGPQGGFDWVFEHTCFCAIDPSMRQRYVESVSDLLVPGGLLVAVFFINPWDEGEDPSQGPPFGTPVGELDRYFEAGFERIEDRVPVEAYPGREGRERFRVLRKRG